MQYHIWHNDIEKLAVLEGLGIKEPYYCSEECCQREIPFEDIALVLHDGIYCYGCAILRMIELDIEHDETVEAFKKEALP